MLLLAIEQNIVSFLFIVFFSRKFNILKLSYNARNVMSVKTNWFKMNCKFVTCFRTISLLILTYLYLGASLRRSCPKYVFKNLVKKKIEGLFFVCVMQTSNIFSIWREQIIDRFLFRKKTDPLTFALYLFLLVIHSFLFV